MGLFDFLKGKEAPKTENNVLILGAPSQGKFVPMAQVPDEVFSQGIMGVCCGIDPSEGAVYAPADGTITQLTDTLHAVGLQCGNADVLIHVGVDTVAMAGDGFSNVVKEGQQVKKGELMLTMDLEKIKSAGHPTTVIMAVTNSDDFTHVDAVADGAVQVGGEVLRISK